LVVAGSAPWQLFEFADPWTVWGTTLRTELAGAEESGIRAALLDVADYFLKTTGVLRAEMVVDIAAGQRDYPINDYFGHENLIALLVHAVNLGDRWQRPSAPVGASMESPPTRRPRLALVVHPQVLRLYGTPTEHIERGLGVQLSYKLAAGADCVPLLLAEHYYEAVRDGVLGRMKAHTKRQYSDQQASVEHKILFRRGIAEARDEVRKRWSNAEIVGGFNPDWTRRASAGAYRR
jgi:hypothetical protein